MAKTNVIAINYEGSDSIELQGKRDKIQKYLDNGYYVKESRNGYWVLVKTARVNVTLSDGEVVQTYNMKSDVCDHYGKQRVSSSLVERFKKDVNSGNITITLDQRGGYSFN